MEGGGCGRGQRERERGSREGRREEEGGRREMGEKTERDSEKMLRRKQLFWRSGEPTVKLWDDACSSKLMHCNWAF